MLVGLCTEWAKKVGPQNHGHGYRILADFQNIVFSWKIRWCGGQEHKVHETATFLPNIH